MTTVFAPELEKAPGSNGSPGRPFHMLSLRVARLWGACADRAVPWVTGVFAVVPIAVLVAITVVLFHEALPAIRINGIGFLTRSRWDVGSGYGIPIKVHGVEMAPHTSYGAWPLILGTLESSALALVIAVPISVGAAIIVVEKLPPRLSRWAGICLEVLVGIPSVIYGLWGILTLGPFLSKHLAGIADHVPDVPVLRFFRGPTYGAEGLLVSGIVLGIMIIPIIASTSRDLIRQVPSSAKEGARALGMTDFEVVRKVIWPWTRSGIVGASVLGLGRALGETMAVAMTSGAVLGTTAHSIFSHMNTIAATIVSQLDSAFADGTGFEVKVLAELGLVLIVITLLCNFGAKLLLKRFGASAIAPAAMGN